MNAAKQQLLERKRFSKIVSDWVAKNKKVFWKYEVSCFHETYRISINNLPEPAEKDIAVSPVIRLLNDKQKKQLCDALKNAYAKTGAPAESGIDLKVNFIDGGAVTAEIIQQR